MKLRLLPVFILLLTSCLFGQTFRGTILGTVTDPSGAVVAGGYHHREEHGHGSRANHPDEYGRQLRDPRVADRNLYGDDFSGGIPDIDHT